MGFSETFSAPFFPAASLRLAIETVDGRRAMELIETQASDLRYLAQAPVALSDTASVSYDTPQPLPQGSPGSAPFGENSAVNANKRKPPVDDGDGQKQTRSKRNRVRPLLTVCAPCLC